MIKSDKQKRNLKITLLILDIIVLLAIFVSVFLMFELVIKKLLVNYSINKFHENIRTTQFDLSSSIGYIDEKENFPYKENALKVFEYSKISTLNRAKYDNSIMAIIFPEEQNMIIAGKKNDLDIDFDKNDLKYDDFLKMIKLINIENNTSLKIKNQNVRNYITFNFKGRSYIGIAEESRIKIRKNLERESADFVKPILIVADRTDEFFYLINRVEISFLVLLLIVFGIGSYIKITNTITATREIYSVSTRMADVSNQIKNTGIVSGSLEELLTRFKETHNLDNSFRELVGSLVNVGDIISGIADRELFIATLKNDNTLLNPHDEMMATVFLDIQGFTTIAEKHKEKVMSIVNQIWVECEKVISKRYGKINKYEGDACLIIFRDLDNKSDKPTALNAFYTGVDIIELVPKLCKDLDIDFKFRVGIDYGKVTYGKTGTDNNFELGVIGDTVNTSARLEALNKQYHTNILFTDNVFQNAELKENNEFSPKNELINDINIKCIKVDRTRPKGKKEAKELYTVIKNNGENEFTFIGSEKYFKLKEFELFTKLHKYFIESIKPWQKYHSIKSKHPGEQTEETINLKEKAEDNWSKLAMDFAKFYSNTGFPLADQFVRLILKFEEYEQFQKRPEIWISKPRCNVKQPDEEWITLGTVELGK